MSPLSPLPASFTHQSTGRTSGGRSSSRRIARTLAIVLIGGVFGYCGGTKQADLDHPPALSAFAWDAPVAKTVSNLKAAGWRQTSAVDGRIEFEASRGSETEGAEAVDDGDLPNAPADASVTLFSRDDSLKVVRLVRRGNRTAIRAYVSDLAQDFDVEGAVWESEPRESDSATGNRTTRREQLFETPSTWIAARMAITEAAEAQLSEASISEVELQFFGKSTNEGLSQSALVKTLEQE
ncbi:MAG: hypothetical protein RIF32_09280 [Leptospirales bacterium]|jgi:hypothetical protein